MQGRGALRDQFKEYLLAKDLDRKNESRPTLNLSEENSIKRMISDVDLLL